jgi:predicted RNA-binding Zn-ribbon protein involved in translation (DUF1610 family)
MSGDSKLRGNVTSSSSTQRVESFKVQSCPECGSTRIMRDYECAEIV